MSIVKVTLGPVDSHFIMTHLTESIKGCVDIEVWQNHFFF